MDDLEFKRKLSEVAEWKIPENLQELEKATPRKRRKTKVIEYDESSENNGNEDFNGVEETISQGANLPLQLVGLKVKPAVCEDCGRRCKTGHRKETKLFETKTHKAWRHHCLTCGFYSNPYTGEFDLSKENYTVVWTDWGRGVKDSQYVRKNQNKRKGDK